MALPFLHEHELPEAVRFEMQQEEEAQKASGVVFYLQALLFYITRTCNLACP